MLKDTTISFERPLFQSYQVSDHLEKKQWYARYVEMKPVGINR